MQGEKTIPRKKYALSFIVVGAVLAVLGVILNFVLDPKATFDLPWFIRCLWYCTDDERRAPPSGGFFFLQSSEKLFDE